MYAEAERPHGLFSSSFCARKGHDRRMNERGMAITSSVGLQNPMVWKKRHGGGTKMRMLSRDGSLGSCSRAEQERRGEDAAFWEVMWVDDWKDLVPRKATGVGHCRPHPNPFLFCFRSKRHDMQNGATVITMSPPKEPHGWPRFDPRSAVRLSEVPSFRWRST